jgi:hypothetical protein
MTSALWWSRTVMVPVAPSKPVALPAWPSRPSTGCQTCINEAPCLHRTDRRVSPLGGQGC